MSEAKYNIIVSNAIGVREFIITDFLNLQYQKTVNDIGLMSFSVLDTHPMALGIVERDWQVEVIRKRAADPNISNAIAAYTDFGGFIREEERITSSDGTTLVTYYAVGWNDLLRRSIIAYKADVVNRTQFVASNAERIMKILVARNATTSGTTADGRDRNVPAWGGRVSVQTDLARGNLLDMFFGRVNLLDALQQIADIGGGDFDLVKLPAFTTAWEFRWYTGQLGTDRTATVTFALQYGNMANPTLRYRRLEEKTVAIVAGQEVAGVRSIESVTGTNYNADTNSYEIFVDGSDITTTAGLQNRGSVKLYELRAREELSFDVIQTPGSLYGLHYFLGDKVTGYFQGVSATKKIQSVSINFDASGLERVSLGLQAL